MLSSVLILLGLVLPGWAGCGSASSGPPPSSDVVLETKRVSADELPIGGRMPPMDEGRVVLAPPQDWYAAPRRRGYVVQFYRDKTRQARIPRIWVTAELSPFEDLSTVDANNLEQFVHRVAERLAADGVDLVEPVRPMIIGPTPCARYVRLTTFAWEERGRKQQMTAERQMLEILVDGRLYTVDLHVPPRKILDYRDAGYAVAASMQFPQAGQDDSPPRTDPQAALPPQESSPR